MSAPVHFSDLKRMAISPAHYHYGRGQVQREPTRAMLIGTIVDYELTGGVGSIEEWAGPRRGKAWQQFQADNLGKTVVTSDEYQEAMGIVNCARDSPFIYYLAGRHQTPLRWEMYGFPCATRGVDVIGDGWISDLKVTHCAQPERLMRHARSMLWHCQLAFYLEGCRQNGIDTRDGAYIVALESKPPHPMTVLHLNRDCLEEANRTISAWFERLRVCTDADSWPGYTQAVVEMGAWSGDVLLEGLDDELGTTTRLV